MSEKIDAKETPVKEQEKNEQLRRKYLEAMAIGLGANPITVGLSIDALLKASNEFSDIDVSKDRNSQDPDARAKIEAIGEWYLFGSGQAHQLKYSVGLTILALLTTDLKSGYFKHLRDYVDLFTDGVGGKKFDKILSGHSHLSE